MNCRPGDLAVVVRGFPKANLGRVVRVIEINLNASAIDETPIWRYEGFLDGRLGGRAPGCSDSCLRPIRDPGADAVDEMVHLVGPAPMTLTEILQGEVSS